MPQLYVLSALSKVFPDEVPKNEMENNKLTALKGETVSFQVAFFSDAPHVLRGWITADTSFPGHVRIRDVVTMPARYAAPVHHDDNYIRTTPGMYPDLLRDLPTDGKFMISAGVWKSFWIDVEVTEEIEHGDYPIAIKIHSDDAGGIDISAQTGVTVLNAVLPEQTLIHTEWFHSDCLADYYNVASLSEEHWDIIEKFVLIAVKRGINMILTPQFTPPLDTAVGKERTTVQLVDVKQDNGIYSFDFKNLKRWVDMCQRCGVKEIELSHLFTQWGATAAPKIMATVDGTYKRIFGWDTPAVGGEYTKFLRAYLPELINFIKDLGIEDCIWFHISDEPYLDTLETYRAANESIADIIKDFKRLDALSNLEIYNTGAVERPACANNHIEPFLEAKIPHLWCYYCVSQDKLVSNRFFSMPSARNRIYGVQLYKFQIEGILHWGYNFYNSQFSERHINPYEVTDCDGAFPAGDAFLVYPGKDGIPEESIRMMVQYQAMTDLRALQALEKLSSREHVLSIIEDGLAEPITFSKYPLSDFYLINLRNRINLEIKNLTK